MSDDEYDLAAEPAPAGNVPPRGTRPQPATRAAVAPAAAAAPATARPGARAPAASSGAFVRGNRIVVKDGAVLPDRCIKCNAPAAEGRRKKRFAFNEDTSGPGLKTAIPLIGPLFRVFWLIGQISSRQHVTVSFCVCKKHQTQRLILTIVMAAGLIGGVALVGTAISQQNLALGLIGAVVFLAGAICGAGSKLLSVANGLNNAAEMTGAGKAFMDSLPKGGIPRMLNKYGR
jgi:hypothetical protein